MSGEDIKTFFQDNTTVAAGIGGTLAVLVVLCALKGTRTFLIQILATIWLWVSFWGSHFVTFIIQLIISALTIWWLPAKYRQKILGAVQQITIFWIITINPFWWIKVVKRTKVPKGSIVMANHLSYVDSWVIASAIFPTAPKFVAMGKLFQMPVFGQVMKMAWHIPVIFYKREEDGKWGVKNKEQIHDMSAQHLDWKSTLMVFPEGTLSYDGELKKFKPGFFDLAMEKNAPIVPIASWGNSDMFPPGNQFALAGFAKVKIAMGDPIYPSDFSSADELKEFTRNTIKKLRDGLPNFDLYDRKPELLESPQAEEDPKSADIDLPVDVPTL